MDVCGVFLGDSSLSYGSMRNAVYRDYEQFPYGTFENYKSPVLKDSYSKAQEKCQQVKTDKHGKQSCPFCKEHKKRPLISYLRKKTFQKNDEKICEEDEDDNEHNEHHQNDDHDHKLNSEQNECNSTEKNHCDSMKNNSV